MKNSERAEAVERVVAEIKKLAADDDSVRLWINPFGLAGQHSVGIIADYAALVESHERRGEALRQVNLCAVRILNHGQLKECETCSAEIERIITQGGQNDSEQ